MQEIVEKAVIFLIYFVVLEPMITKYIFNNVIFKYLPEVIIYGLAALFVIFQISENKKIAILKHELSLIVLPAYIFVITVIINKIDIQIFFLSIRTLYRYIVLYFIVANIEFTEENIGRILKHIRWCGIIVLLVGVLQILLPQLMNPILMPKVYKIGNIDRESSIVVIDGKAIFSLFERYDRYGTFLIILIFLILAGVYKNKCNILIIILASINMVFTYSRQSWIGLGAGLLVGLVLEKRYFIIFFVSSAAALGLTVLLTSEYVVQDIYFGSPFQRVLQVFSPSYMQTNLESARLRIFVDVLPEFLSGFKIYTIFGLGIGSFADLANSMTNYELYMRYFLLFDVEYSGTYHVSDVYWIELTMELGIIGIAIFGIYFIRTFGYYYDNYKRKESRFLKQLNLLAIRLTVSTIIINFFGPNMLITGYSFFLWLLLGITVRSNSIKETLEGEA